MNTETKLCPEKPNWPDGVIYVEVHHQTGVFARGFLTREDYEKWLLTKAVSSGFCFDTFTRPEWEAMVAGRFGENWREDDDAVKLFDEGEELFKAGASAVVERCNGYESFIEDAKDAGTALDYAWRIATHDFHAAYLLDRAETLALLTDEPGAPVLSHHEYFKARSVIRKEAKFLEWCAF
jgi:hypothetical protein